MLDETGYCDLYELIFQRVKDKDVAIAILNNLALDNRTILVNTLKSQEKPTSAQIWKLDTFVKQGLLKEIPKNLNKEEASKLISSCMENKEVDY
jgi:hypothetical protein